MSRFAIYGCGGFGCEVAPLARQTSDDVVFVSDIREEQGTVVNGYQVLSLEELASAAHRDRIVAIAVGSAEGRRTIADRCEAKGLSTGSVFASTFIAYDGVDIGEGAIFCDFTMVTANARIGRSFQCNIYSYVAHDCVIGDYVTFAPRVSCNGNVSIGDGAYIGTGAVLKQGSPSKPLRIGEGAVIGMGAVVTKDVPAGETWIGNPAKPMLRG